MTDPLPAPIRAFATMQTSVLVGGSRLFDGDVDRFVLFALIVRAGLVRADRSGVISAHSLALSLSRPFETVRRHVNALVAEGLCHRERGGVRVAQATWGREDIARMLRLKHDCFVRLIEDSLPVDPSPPRSTASVYEPAWGIQAAVDLVLATLDSHRQTLGDALDLLLFATVAHGNAQRHRAEGGEGWTIRQRHAVRISELARTLAGPETTIRRRLATIAGPGCPIERTTGGLVISTDWLASEAATAASERMVRAFRRIVARVAAQGFPLAAPREAYIDGRPPALTVA